MKRVLPLLLTALCYLLWLLPARAQAPQWQWANAQSFVVNSVATDAQGNAYVTGQFSGSITVGRFSLTSSSAIGDLLVAKFGPTGRAEWVTPLAAQPFATGSSTGIFASGTDISVNPVTGESVVVGRMNGLFASSVPGSNLPPDQYITDKFVVLKLSAAGSIQWAVQGGSSNLPTTCNAIATDAAGNSYLTGISYGYRLSSGGSVAAGPRQLFVLSLNGAGAFRWNTLASAPLSSMGIDIGTDALHGVYMLGTYFGPLTIGGSTLPGPPSGTVLARLDGTTGNVAWARGDQSGATALAVDAAGHSYLAGGFSGTYALGAASLMASAGREGFVAHLDPAGTVAWLKSVGAAEANGGAALSDGAPVVWLKRSASGGAVIGLKPGGAISWELAASGIDGSKCLATAPGLTPLQRRVVTGGTFTGAATFGSYPVSAAGSGNFLASMRFVQPIGPGNVVPLSVYPNPAQNLLTVRLPTAPGTSVQLVSLQGRVVRQHLGSDGPGVSELVWNVADLPRGLYTVRAVGSGQVQTLLVELN
ncbi:T9SS type A sorting domain-containing protein [Hymenobacter jeollabukensis]|uniref:T9SS type A sorting domain-containing protein n=1 Tax=Hymenobacter jeollabukensis TaxID=2025313 RepID=A0A5R8WV45_9BACT|nr:T9SS type A sorting domain-containing protein [Hymenobacter jeollabukensis]TLM95587.1 T9SS type A sorting domain-containing protein [Hymenobacter jeollabukensis]